MNDPPAVMGSTTLEDASSAINNDSNSLEAGEIIDDTPPIIAPSEEGGAPQDDDDMKNSINDLDHLGLRRGLDGGKMLLLNTVSSSSPEKRGSSSKPVLGKEKAKQRLKAIGIQKKIQMESKQSRPDKISRKKSRDKSTGGSSSKKDKPPTPHEKAKLTKEEIEKLKEKQDCALPCLYYDAAMIHHIRADCPEKKTPSTADCSNKMGPCVTASLEAIKNYDDQDEVPEGSDNLEKISKIPLQTMEILPGEQQQQHQQHQHQHQQQQHQQHIRNYKQARRKLTFRGSGDFQQQHHFAMRGRDKMFRNRFGPERIFNPHLRNIRKFRDPNRRLQRELPRLPQILSEGGTMYTKTKPVITFSVNPNILKTASSSIIEHKKTRKKSKRKSSINKTKPKKKSRSKSRRSDSKKSTISVKGKKKKKSNKKDRGDKKERSRRTSKHKKSHPPRTCGALSFHLNEFLPEEEVETFPLSKDTVETMEDQDEDDTALENKLKSLQAELNKKSPSPDTDDYMANWEEEEDFATVPLSIDSTPKKPIVSAINIGSEDQNQSGLGPPADLVQGMSPEGSNTPRTAPIIGSSSSPEKGDPDQSDPEIRDGLGTPIFVNPSPPAEMISASMASTEDKTPPVPQSKDKEVTVEEEEAEEEDEAPKINEIPPKIPSSPLFGMQVIYEQFIQSVSEAGIELSLNSQSPGKITSDGAPRIPVQQTIDEEEEECSFTPNASPTSGKICQDLEYDNLSSKVTSSPKSGSSTPTDSSSDTASSTSSTTTDTSSESATIELKAGLTGLQTPIFNNAEDVENSEKKSTANLPSILSPEDTQKLRSLHKRSRMLKNLQKQSDAMDDEDKQCLLGLEKLIEAEKNLLMRKYDVARDLTEELKLSDASSACDSPPETPDGVTPPRNDLKTDAIDELEANKIFDVNREAVKLKFSPKAPKSTSRVVTQPSEEDEDFTEKLLKTSSSGISSSSKEYSDSGERKKRERKFSRSVSRSPEGQKSIRRGRSLSISPIRRTRDQWGDKQKRSKRQRHYSPPPSNRKRSSGSGDSKKASRSHRWPLSPLIRKRSRSPYVRRFSRSPPFRPPSPKSPPPQGRSTSPSKERNSRLDSDGGGPNDTNYSWSDDASANYYPHNESYYYIPSPAQGGGAQKPRLPCEAGEFYHPNYRLYNYNYDYQTMGLYANSYGNEYVGPEPMSSYSRIPVINSAGGNYCYDDFETDETHNSQSGIPIGEHSEANNNHNSNNKQIPHDDTGSSGSIGEKKQFVVQKGNVLEIVPTSIIPKIEMPDTIVTEKTDEDGEEDRERHEHVPVIKVEQDLDLDCGNSILSGNNNDKKVDIPFVLKMEKIPTEKRKKKRKSQDFVLWEDEIAKRHILSAVLRLNKEDDGTLRGILYSKPMTEKPREKKRVIFADGIPPGKSSSTSDEESSPIPLRIPRRMKKKRRRKGEENKENETTMGIDKALTGDVFKIDPELENLPPPPPPPGDPPAHLPQPVLLKPPSPEQFLYFHFDPVVNSMYISNSPTPMPPRLLNRGMQSIAPLQMGPPSSGTPRNPSNFNQSNIPMGGNVPPQSNIQVNPITAKGCFIPRDPGSIEQGIIACPKLGEPHPLGPVPPHQHPDRRFRPQQQQQQQQSFMPPMMVPSGVGGEFRPPSPINPGFIMFNRPPLRASPGNMNRSGFPVPPPSRQPTPPPPQQQQQMLGHPSIPFGPRPPGGVANFNRNIPPPYIGPQRGGDSPSMISNFQPTQQGLGPAMGSMRSPSSVQLFTPNPGSMPGFTTPTVTLRPPGGMSSPIVAFSNSGFTPPPSTPANVKNIPILMGKSSGVPPPPGGQFSRNNGPPMMGCGGENFIPNTQQGPPHPAQRSGPFNTSGMPPVQMHRPNLGFPRSFGPPPPSSPQMQQQQMFMQQQQQQGGGAPPQSPIRPMFPSPAGNYQFLRNDGIIADQQQHPGVQQTPQHPLPHPVMSPATPRSQGSIGGGGNMPL